MTYKNTLILTLLIILSIGKISAQTIYRFDFEHAAFISSKDSLNKITGLQRYFRTGEVDPKKCVLPQNKALASAEVSKEFSRNGKYAGKVTLDVSGGIGHKAMFRNTLFKAGTKLSAEENERWIGFSCLLPDTGKMEWATDSIPELIFQLHNDIVASPMLAIYSQNDVFQITYRYSDLDPHLNKTPLNPNVVTRKVWSARTKKGVWLDWVFHVQFSPENPEGFLEVWLNSGNGYEKIVDKKQIRIGYLCTEETDLDIGIYKWAWKCPTNSSVKTRTLFVDDITVADGKANFETVALGSW